MNDARTEARLRETLGRRASAIEPPHRLEAILAEAHQPAARASWWAVPAAVAAAVVLLLVGLVLVGNAGGGPVTSAGTPSAVPSPSGSAPGSASPTPSASASASASGSAPGPTAQAAVPVYVIDSNGARSPRYGLYREFHRVDLPEGPTPADRVRAAVGLAMATPATLADGGSVRPWSGVGLDGVTVTADRITVTVSGDGPSGLDARIAELAVQQVVWSAQAAVGKGNVPVRVVRADAGTTVFGTVSIAAPFMRPPADQYYTVLGDIWITLPEPGATLPATDPITVSGEATVFEGTLQWEVRRGTEVLRSGMTTTSAGGPMRGTYTISVGRLPAGAYVLRVWADSMRDGSVAAQREVSVTVR
jgi:hypothetical protein